MTGSSPHTPFELKISSPLLTLGLAVPSFFSSLSVKMNPRLFFLIFAILIHVPTYLSADDAQYATCGELLQCANIPNIGYPFWGGSRPESCGYPGFQLTNCQGDAPIITMERLQFRVLAMDNEAQSLTVARQDMWNQTCPTYLYNTTLDYNLFSYAPNQQNITLLYDCIAIQTQTIPYQFDCNVNSTASISYFTSGTLSLPSIPNNITVCNKSVTVPVNQTSGTALSSSSATVREMEAALGAGFELQWAANNTRCTQCSESGGRCGYNTTTLSFACYCSDQPYPLTCNSAARAYDSAFPPWLTVVLPAMAGIIVLSIVILCCCRRKWLLLKAVVFWKKEKTDYENVEEFVRTYGSQFPKYYRYTDLKIMTNKFADKLGQGGYGSVFKGTLPDGRVVAVKLLNEAKGNGEEFINEVASMSRTSHVNIVKLLGFCFEGSKRALIYEFMPNSSLDKFICSGGSFYTSSRLDWKTLYQIALGTARGLEYLHRGCNTQIVHFDIKPHNILLDEDFCPKISDFGLAKLCKRKESVVSVMGARGTPGYIAPEIFFRNFGAVSHKSDVYSYGMVVLEMAGVRENAEVQSTRTCEIYFPDWIFEQLEPGKDLRVNGAATEYEEETARKMILVSLWCIQTNPLERPAIRKVVEMLEGTLQPLQIPPKPTWSAPLMPAQGSSTLFPQSSESNI